jgi:putative inorganic carbon (HCO3(-)) transporter
LRLGPQFITIIAVSSAVLIFGLVALLTTLLPPKVILLVIGGTVAFILTIVRVEIGLAILIFIVPWTMQYEVSESFRAPVEIGSDDVLVLCILFGWLGYTAIHKDILFHHSTLNWPIAAFIVISLLSLAPMFATKSFDATLVALLHLVKWVEYAFIYFVVVEVVRNQEKAKGFLYLALASAVVVAVVQVFLMATKQYTGITYTPEGPIYWTLPGFESNGILGAYYVFFIGIALAFSVNNPSRLMQGLMIGCVVLLLYCLFFTFSRAAYIGLVAAMIVVAVWSTRVASRVPLIIFMVGLLGLVFFLEPVMTRITMTVTDLGRVPTLESSAHARLISWQAVFKVLASHPLNAVVGIGFWGSRFHGAFGFSTPHNWYLALLVETGVFGLGVFCWLMKRIIHNAVRLYRQAVENPFLESLAIGYLAGLVGLLVHAFFGETFESFRILGPFWFVTGIVIASVMIQEEGAQMQIETVTAPEEYVPEPVLATTTRSKRFVERFFE